MHGSKLARLYKRKTKSGKVYLEGKMTGVTRLVIVENDRKERPRDPDYYAYVVPDRGSGKLDDADLSDSTIA